MGHIEYQHGKNDGDDLPSMLYGRPTLGGGVQALDDRISNFVPDSPKG